LGAVPGSIWGKKEVTKESKKKRIGGRPAEDSEGEEKNVRRTGKTRGGTRASGHRSLKKQSETTKRGQKKIKAKGPSK